MIEIGLFGLATGLFIYFKFFKKKNKRELTGPGAPLPDKPVAWNWFRYAMQMSTHLLIVGKTESGKSHLTTALIIARSYIGKVIIISPIARPQDYAGLGIYAIGRGENVEAIRRAYLTILDERARRAQLLAERGETLEPLTIVIDEIPWLIENLEAETQNFMSNIASSGRHYNLRGIFLTQTALIKDIGGSTAMQENFNVIYLGTRARVLAKERLKKPEIFNGVDFPTLFDVDGQLKIIKRDFIPHIFNGGKFALDGKVYGGFQMAALWKTPADFESDKVKVTPEDFARELLPNSPFERGNDGTNRERERILELANQGMKPYQIAQRLGGRYQTKLEKVKEVLEIKK